MYKYIVQYLFLLGTDWGKTLNFRETDCSSVQGNTDSCETSDKEQDNSCTLSNKEQDNSSDLSNKEQDNSCALSNKEQDNISDPCNEKQDNSDEAQLYEYSKI